jgi:hypothetical protein
MPDSIRGDAPAAAAQGWRLPYFLNQMNESTAGLLVSFSFFPFFRVFFAI